MEYDFNQNNTLNGATSGLGGTQRSVNEYLQDFIIRKPYGLELYEFDYKFRVDQYFSEEVRKYKGSESELNVEVTYRITIDNKEITDADDVLAAGKTVTRTPLIAKVNEIMDLYEINLLTSNYRVLKTIEEVYCDQLVQVVDELVERPPGMTDFEYGNAIKVEELKRLGVLK